MAKKHDSPADALRSRANNRALLLVNLSDHDARTARIVMEHIADALEGKDEPDVAVPEVRKLSPGQQGVAA